jgi:transposase
MAVSWAEVTCSNLEDLMNKKYIVRLSPNERAQLDAFLAAGKAPARTQTHARILLKADCGPDGPAWPDLAIAEALDVSLPTIQRVRQTLVLQGFDAALHRKPQPARPRKVDGRHEAYLAALACSTPPLGFKRWTLRLLTKHFVALEEVELESIGRETVRQVLKKTSSNPG